MTTSSQPHGTRPPERPRSGRARSRSGRGGFYSYDWLENLAGLDIRSTDRIIPELQHLDVGDIIRLAPHIGMAVAAITPARALVIRSVADIRTKRPVDRGDSRFFDWSWAFILDELGERTTRLIVRERADFIPSPGMTVLGDAGVRADRLRHEPEDAPGH